MRLAAFASFFFLCITIRAQVAYSVSTDALRAGSRVSDPIDSVDYDFFRYNPGYRYYTLFNDLGNIGSSVKNLFVPLNTATGFREGFDVYNPLRFREDTYRNYITRRAYTDLNYVQGGKEMLNLRAIHAQNIKPWWNIGIQFNRLKSDGHYLNQKTSIYNTRIFNWFHTRDYRYQVFVNITWNRITNRENGGITSDSTFESLTGNLRQTDVFLASARNSNKQNIYSVEQHYHFGKIEKQPLFTDTSRKTVRDSFLRVVPQFTIAHKIAYTGDRYVFSSSNNDSLLYPGGAFNTLDGTHDSSQFRKLRNTFSLLYHHQNDHYETGIRHETIHFSNGYSSANLYNASLFLNGLTYLATRLSANWEAEYFLGGYNANDRKIKADLYYSLPVKNSRHGFRAVYLNQVYRPTFIQYFNYSNHYFWKNDFAATQQNSLSLGWDYRHRKSFFSINAIQSNFTNAVYFDTLARPAQANYNLLTLTANSLLNFGKMNLQFRFTYQHADNELIRIPDFGIFGSLFYQGPMFNRVLFVKAGADISYYAAYKAPFYDPSTRQFYNQDRVMVGDYPVVDLYLTGYVKTFSIGFKLEHANQGLSGDRYYATAHYPMAPRVFRVVIGWKLFD